jgi:hypothetical protein
MKHAALLNIDPDQDKAIYISPSVKNMDSLTAGLKQIQGNLDSQLSIHEIFTNIVGILFESFYFTQVCIAIKKKETQTMDARFVKGNKSQELLKGFSFKLENSLDIFNHAVLKKRDIIVKDVQEKKYKKKIPSWYMDLEKNEQAFGLVVFPVFVDQKIISMMVVSWDSNAHSMNQKTLDYLSLFRELMVKTFTLHARKHKN